MDTEKVEKARNGNVDEIGNLLMENMKSMYRVAFSILKTEEEISDAISNTTVIVFEKMHTLKNAEFFKTWLIRILINECNKIYKMKKYKREDSYETVGSTLVSPDKTEEQINFKFICDKLSEEDGTIILLYYMEKYTDREIGEILNMKENTVRTKRNRIKNKIKKFYEEYWRI